MTTPLPVKNLRIINKMCATCASFRWSKRTVYLPPTDEPFSTYFTTYNGCTRPGGPEWREDQEIEPFRYVCDWWYPQS